MRRFSNLPIRQKLTMIVLFTSGLLVMFMAVFFIADKFFSFRRNMVSNMTTLAQVIGMNSTAALTFDDPGTAKEILSAISAEPNVEAACIFRSSKELFAAYPADPKGGHPYKSVAVELINRIRTSGQPDKEAYAFSDRYLILAKAIVMKHKQIGYILIRANLNQLYGRLVMSCLIVIGVTALMAVVVQLITARLHRTISDPVLDLVATMDRVTADKNYSVRAHKTYDDEFGTLIDGFNDMLTQIQERDQQLEHHRQQLEVKVTQRTQALIRSHEQLEHEMEERKQMQDQLARAQRMEAIGTLAAGVAHDLNNILSGIVSYPDLLLMRLPADSDLRKPILTMQNSGKKAAAIVQDLLTLARRGVITSEVVQLTEVLDDYLESPEHEKLLGHHPHVRISRQVAPDLMDIAGSPVHLGKTIMNLITNAFEAIPDAGTVTLTLRNQYIDKPISGYDEVQQGDYVLFKISDNGHGIADRDLERIFEPFYTKKKMGRSGTGLGMAVVWGTVKDHQGYIDVTSQQGEGTTFSLYFPVTRRKLDAHKPVQLADYMGAGESILVVDDIEEQRVIASEILHSLG